jgi:hypothetical protein
MSFCEGLKGSCLGGEAASWWFVQAGTSVHSVLHFHPTCAPSSQAFHAAPANFARGGGCITQPSQPRLFSDPNCCTCIPGSMFLRAQQGVLQAHGCSSRCPMLYAPSASGRLPRTRRVAMQAQSPDHGPARWDAAACRLKEHATPSRPTALRPQSHVQHKPCRSNAQLFPGMLAAAPRPPGGISCGTPPCRRQQARRSVVAHAVDAEAAAEKWWQRGHLDNMSTITSVQELVDALVSLRLWPPPPCGVVWPLGAGARVAWMARHPVGHGPRLQVAAPR